MNTKKVLAYYLDDENLLCKLFEECLLSKHVMTKTFTEVDDFISTCQLDIPDIAFIDYRLIDTTGDVVAQKIPKETIKILVTGELDAPNTSLFYKVISKPFKLREIIETVSETTGRNDLFK